ncbi:MAG: ATP-binding protein [Candidatus Marsarchaeota archaeon]|nr:ATP-binding protein [Candidatus Marsarchaeota archaeon]
MVLGSGGIVAIDEFDKIGDEDRAALHEALESQTISVAKAGIIATFNAKAAVLAAANPKFGRFDSTQYPAEQFDIPPTLLSRFATFHLRCCQGST